MWNGKEGFIRLVLGVDGMSFCSFTPLYCISGHNATSQGQTVGIFCVNAFLFLGSTILVSLS